MHIEDILHPNLGYPIPRDTHLDQQGVTICDCVGTHLGYSVVKNTKAIEISIEILLRVPNLSFVLKGENTINFKMGEA